MNFWTERLRNSDYLSYWIFIESSEKIGIGQWLPIYLLPFPAIAPQSHTQKTKWFRQIKLYDWNFGEKDVDGFRAKRKKGGGCDCQTISKGCPQDHLTLRVSCKICYKQIIINNCKGQRSWSGWTKRWIENTKGTKAIRRRIKYKII